jgi:hypothetical protein
MIPDDPKQRCRIGAALIAASLGLAPGCGYTYGLDSGAAGDARTVAVEVVRNDSFRQLLERPLNDELYRALAEYSMLVPARRDRADVVLTARLQGITGEAVVPGGRLSPIREGALVYSVEVRLVERRSGRVLREASFRDRTEFRVPVGEDEDSANLEAARDIARRIVLALDDDF